MKEETRAHRIAWIPWVLALVALLGLNSVYREDSRVRRNDPIDGIGLSLASQDPEMAGRVSNPLVPGPPAPLIDTTSHDPGETFVKLEAGRIVVLASLRHGAVQGRAPPVVG